MSRRSEKSEQGAVAVIVAVSMLAMLVVAGLVLDFGLARTNKVTNKGYTDSAAAAGIRANDGGDGSALPYRGVCAALAYLRVNDPDMATLSPTWSAECASGSALLEVPCVPNTTQASYSGTADGGRISVEVKSGYKTTDAADNGSGDRCDQLAVFVSEANKPGLGSLASTDDIVTSVRTVARMTSNTGSESAAALLMLERSACDVVTLNSNNTKIEVKGNGDAPGTIHSDSTGSAAGCSPSTPVLSGKFAGNIIARRAETGSPILGGNITTVAGTGVAPAVAANATDGAAKVCAEAATGVCAAATGRTLIGRGLVDRRYLGTSTTGVTGALTAAANAYNLAPQGAATAAGYTVVNSCNLSGNVSPADKVFVFCPAGPSFSPNVTFNNATTVVFNGPIAIGNGSLSIPNAERVYVKGTAGGTGVSGSVSMNHGGLADCTLRGTAVPRAQLVIGNGSFVGGNNAVTHLCSTTVIMGESAFAVKTATNCPVPVSRPALGTPGAAPYPNTCGSKIDVGGGAAVDWTAPNTTSAQALQADWDNLEDLALWTEAANGNSLGGGGGLAVSGVFFLPNANAFTLGGNSLNANGQNAQFVASRLALNGGAQVKMRPSPKDAITIPLPPTFSLVR